AATLEWERIAKIEDKCERVLTYRGRRGAGFTIRRAHVLTRMFQEWLMTSTDNSQLANGLPSITHATVISRSPSVLTADIDNETLIMRIEHGDYFSLNCVGSDIWRRLESPCCFSDLVNQLAADYDATKVSIATDVHALLSRMAVHDIVALA